jgi:hypothetical protein
MTIPKNPLATNVTLTIEFCSDLNADSWTSAGAVIMENTGSRMVIRDSVAMSEAVRRFARVRGVIEQ